MIPEQMELSLERWKLFIWICFGASGANLLAAIADLIFAPRRADLDQFSSWLLVWILIQVIAVAPATVLTTSQEWRKVPMSLRFQIIFGSLGAAWIALCAFGLRAIQMIDLSGGEIVILVSAVGVILSAAYFRLRKQLLTAPESLFP
jgi:hypothetical protein